MFGNDHTNEDKHDDVQPMSTQPVNNGLLGIDDDNSDSNGVSGAPSVPPVPSPSPGGFSSDTYGDAPVQDNQPDPASTPSVSEEPAESNMPVDSRPKSSDDNELLSIKQEALQELSPLIDHLEQNSEEKFRTTMMMIQASDNKTLIPQAFKSARDISDDKKRAQALLDIVNEINYFTHKNEA